MCNYIQQRSKVDFQCIVISLKDMFYERSESLVGICKDVGTNSSRTLTLDLTQFDKPGKGNKRKTKSEGGGQLSRKRPTPESPATIATQWCADHRFSSPKLVYCLYLLLNLWNDWSKL